jgi:hypothetical protein
MRLFWRREDPTPKHPKGWINLIYSDGHTDSIVEHELLNKDIRELTVSDIVKSLPVSAVLFDNYREESERALKALLAREIDDGPIRRFVAFGCSYEDDPGDDVVDLHYLLASSMEKAEEVLAERYGEFTMQTVWPLNSLIASLSAAAGESDQEYQKRVTVKEDEEEDDE